MQPESDHILIEIDSEPGEERCDDRGLGARAETRPDGRIAKYNDYPEHEGTYKFFVALVKWGKLSVVVLLILMAYFLV